MLNFLGLKPAYAGLQSHLLHDISPFQQTVIEYDGLQPVMRRL